MSPQSARGRSADRSALRPLSEGERTSRGHRNTGAIASLQTCCRIEIAKNSVPLRGEEPRLPSSGRDVAISAQSLARLHLSDSRTRFRRDGKSGRAGGSIVLATSEGEAG